MKKLLIAAAMGAAGLASTGAQAASTATENFNVNITLLSTCAITTPGDVNITYTSGAAGTASSTGGAFTVTCTNTAPFTFHLDGGGATSGGTAFAGALTYGLDVVDGAVAAQTGGTGTGVGVGYAVRAQIVGPQAVPCGGTSCSAGPIVHTLRVDF